MLKSAADEGSEGFVERISDSLHDCLFEEEGEMVEVLCFAVGLLHELDEGRVG